MTSSTNVDCNYRISHWETLEGKYICVVQSSLNITLPDHALILTHNGKHTTFKQDNNIRGVFIDGKIVHYFPKGFEKQFKKIKAIRINRCNLKQIDKSDLRALVNLTYLNLFINDIEVLGKGLFQYNKNLKFIEISINKIAIIHPDVFDNLNNLRYLYIQYNKCIDVGVANSTALVQAVIKEANLSCQSSEPTSTLHPRITESTANDAIQNGENFNAELSEKLKNLSLKVEDIENKLFGITKLIEDLKLELKGKFEKFSQSVDYKAEEPKEKDL